MKQAFGKTKQGEVVSVYTVSNSAGMSASILDYGAVVQKLSVPDNTGAMRDIILGYDDITSYEDGTTFFSAIIGRNANRVDQGKVIIDGVTYQMDKNDNDENNLHSGNNGIDRKVWTVLPQSDESSVTMICKSNDMEQGLPGNVMFTVTYSINDDNEFTITYDAVSDKKTVINPTSHMYFNLNGHYKGDIEGHVVQINADHYNPVIDYKSIPTEENAPVAGTVFDFTAPKTFGKDIEADEIQLKHVGGYDHNYVIRGTVGDLRSFCTTYSEESGICMEVISDMTGTQLYTGNCIGEQKGKGGFEYHNRSGFCFEPQYIPNAMNFIPETSPDSPIFDADEKFHSTSIYKFTVR